MSDFNFTASNRRVESHGSEEQAVPIARKLVMRPESFFSHRFNLEVEEAETDRVERRNQDAKQTGLMRLIDINIVLLVLLIGIPVLAYSILAAL